MSTKGKNVQGALIIALLFTDLIVSAVGLRTLVLSAKASSDPIIEAENSNEEIPVFEETESVLDMSGTIVLADEEEVVLEESMESVEVYREEIDMMVDNLPQELSREFITAFSDLHVDTCPSVETLDKLLEWWDGRVYNLDGEQCGTRYLGHGDAFYEVWEKTGLDPLAILGIAAWEGGWGNSKIALAKNNFYGIGAFDSDPLYWSSNMGDEVHDGIVNGAIWIYENYYLKGYTSLALMEDNGYDSYGGGTDWAETIVEQVINQNYRQVAKIIKEVN